MPGSEAFVHLPGVAHVPVAAVDLAMDLERRGFRLWRDGDELVVTPGARLTPEDCAAIRRWKHHILAIIDYVEQCEVQQ